MSSLKCPNPSCPFLFDPTQVPPGAVLSCPRCAMQFTLGPTAAPPPGYGAPPPEQNFGAPPPGYGAPPPGYGAPPPGYGAPPPGYGAPPVDPQLDYGTPSEGGEEPPPTPVTRGGGLGSILAALGGLMLLCGVGLGVFFFAMKSKHRLIDQSGSGTSDEVRKVDFNFAFQKPPAPWAQDQETQNKLGVNVVAYKRPEPQAWMAFGVSDYEKRNPTVFELQKRMSDQLTRVFDNLPENLEVQPVEWAGQQAQKCEFRGVYMPTGESCFGYCFLLAHKGVGYWYYVWAPERNIEAVGGELIALANGFRILGVRENWGEKVAEQRVYRSKSKLYRLTDYTRIWEKPKRKEATDEDENGDMVLQAVLKGKDRSDFAPTANLVVLVLGEAPGDPLAAARDYIERRYKLFPEITIDEWTGDAAGDPPGGPEDENIPVVRLKVRYGAGGAVRSADTLVVFTAITSGGKTIVAEGSCPWRERSIWERRLMQVTRSLRPGDAQ
ncbi:MAG: hypothetical protein LC104_14350 [Bacteroidales bacterium]|nr:hypothetical protein [Bacteroidales bacterium]